MSSPLPARLIDLGVRAFADVWQLQLDLVAARQREEIPDTLLLVEHPHVLTMGRSARNQNVLAPADMPIFQIERGGDVTYHGPGQLVGYPIFQLREAERDLHLYLRRLEEALIGALAELGIPGGRNPGWTGVWTEGVEPRRKLASIGVAVKSRWVTYHGFALNVSTDLSRFGAINPCGLEATVMASISSTLGRTVAVAEVRPIVVRHLERVFGRILTPAPL